MAKTNTLTVIFAVIVLAVALGSLPSGDVTDSKSAVKNTQKGLVTDTVVKAGGEVIETTGELAIDSACKNGSSQGCSTAVSTFSIVGILFAVLIISIIIAGAIKFGNKMIESF